MGELVVSGFLPLAILVSVLAGLVSFLSPCVLPLIPAYLVMLTNSASPKKLPIATFVFVAGFTLVFVSYGLVFGQVGSWLIQYQNEIYRVAGVLLIIMGLVFAGYISKFQNQIKLPNLKTTGYLNALVLGIVFAVGWTPCIGPTLAAVQTLALTEATATRGAVLSASYSLGLGIPFLLISFFATRSTTLVAALRKKQKLFISAGSAMLIILGILFLVGIWPEMITWLQIKYSGFTVSL
jgi:cytochrome c-type biogenesis protein